MMLQFDGVFGGVGKKVGWVIQVREGEGEGKERRRKKKRMRERERGKKLERVGKKGGQLTSPPNNFEEGNYMEFFENVSLFILDQWLK